MAVRPYRGVSESALFVDFQLGEDDMSVIYRVPRPEDFEAVFRLLNQLWPTLSLSRELSNDVFSRCLASDADWLLCAEYEGEVVGFGGMVIKNSFWQQSFVAYITTLVVNDEHRNRGIGKALIELLSERAKQAGCKRIELDSGFHREQAHLMYEHVGFNKRAFLFSKEII